MFDTDLQTPAEFKKTCVRGKLKNVCHQFLWTSPPGTADRCSAKLWFMLITYIHFFSFCFNVSYRSSGTALKLLCVSSFWNLEEMSPFIRRPITRRTIKDCRIWSETFFLYIVSYDFSYLPYKKFNSWQWSTIYEGSISLHYYISQSVLNNIFFSFKLELIKHNSHMMIALSHMNHIQMLTLLKKRIYWG